MIILYRSNHLYIVSKTQKVAADIPAVVFRFCCILSQAAMLGNAESAVLKSYIPVHVYTWMQLFA